MMSARFAAQHQPSHNHLGRDRHIAYEVNTVLFCRHVSSCRTGNGIQGLLPLSVLSFIGPFFRHRCTSHDHPQQTIIIIRFTAQTSPFLLAQRKHSRQVISFFTRVAKVQCKSGGTGRRALDRAAVCSTPGGGAPLPVRLGGQKSRSPSPPKRQSKKEFHRQVETGDGRRGNRRCRKCYHLLQPDGYR